MIVMLSSALSPAEDQLQKLEGYSKFWKSSKCPVNYKYKHGNTLSFTGVLYVSEQDTNILRRITVVKENRSMASKKGKLFTKAGVLMMTENAGKAACLM